MKTLLSIIVFILLAGGSHALHAQDTLLLKNGDELFVKVEKVNQADVLYSKPAADTVYTIAKANVFMIKFSNGTKYVIGNDSKSNGELSRQEIDRAAKQKIAGNDYERYKKAYTRRKISGITLLSIGGAFATTGVTLICEGIRIDRKDYAYHQSQPTYPKSGWYPQRGMWMTVGGIILTVASFPPLLVGTINMSLTPKYRRKMNEAKGSVSIAPNVEPGNAIYGPQTGMAMRLNF